MKISLNWLKSLIEIPFDIDTLVQKLTFSGLEVESVETQKPQLSEKVVVGFVTDKIQHPNADKLSVCQVDVGGEEILQIVCGAPNVAKGQKVAVATVGSVLPNGLKIKKSKLRGELSQGMICSASELEISEESNGILVLDKDTEIGIQFNDYFKDADTIVEIAVTPNRPDVLGHIGVARDIATLEGKKFVKPTHKFTEIDKNTADEIEVEIEFPEGCPRYSAKIVEGIKVGKSPEWLAKRLEAAGIRSINNVVDVSNYVMLEVGHPMHAFDYSEVKGKKIIVKSSVQGEKFTTLDDIERELDGQTVMICDAERPVAIGGIMGGQNSEINENTTKVLLEAAYFTPSYVRKSSVKLGLKSDASYRFERGTDPNATIYALELAAKLLEEVADGKAYKGYVDNYPNPIEPKEVKLRASRVEKILGISVPQAQIDKTLDNLGITKKSEETYLVPTYRPDIEREIDLIEEIVRIIGYDSVPLKKTAELDFHSAKSQVNYRNELRRFMTGLGCHETLTNTMTTTELAEKFSEKNEPIILANPLSRDYAALRTSMLPAFLEVLRENLNKKSGTSFRFFEIGDIFYKDENVYNKAKEIKKAILLLSGDRNETSTFVKQEDFDFYDIKGYAESILEFTRFKRITFKAGQRPYFTENCLEVVGNGKTIGFVGEVSPKILKEFDVSAKNVFVFEFAFDLCEKTYQIVSKFSHLNKHPFVERDFAFVLDKTTEAGEIVEKLNRSKIKNLTSIKISDLYEGKPLAENKKSIAFSFRFESFERTLTDKEVNEAMDKILKISEQTFGAELRK